MVLSFHSQGGAGWRSTLAGPGEDAVKEHRLFACLLPKVWLCRGSGTELVAPVALLS